MGFPEAEVRHCLRAAHGNPDVAVEFLTNGIPEGRMEESGLVQAAASTASVAATPAGSSSSTNQPPLQALRNHPQFDALRRLVQNNPGMLSQVLTQIGQQQPDLLREINENQSEFLRLMNEPITERSSSSSAPAAARDAVMADEMGDMMGMNPMRMAQIIPTMSEEELSQLAQMMGLTPDQLRQTAQILSQMPEGQMHQFMGEMEAMREAFGGGDGGGGGGGPQVLRLTEEEMAAVNRLTEMGFDRSEAAQAFLACDKNEALAANLLMDSMGDGGGGFFGGGGGGGSDDHQNDGNGGDDGNNNDDDDEDDENMYD
jgi:UV excision repair protein RAD23